MRALGLFLLACLACLGAAQTPSDTVKRFAEALTKRDIKGAVALVRDAKPSEFITMELAKPGTPWPTFTVTDLSEKLSGDTATVSYHIDLTGAPNLPPKHSETLSLAKAGDAWLIVAPKNQVSENEVLPMLATLFANSEQALAGARDAARQTTCISNLKQIAVAIIMFEADNDDLLKMNANNWTTKVAPYMKNEALLRCPLDATGVSYSFNARLAGIDSNKIKSPATTVLAYEGKNGILNFRHKDRAAVAFADGHVKLISKEQAKALNWKP